MKILLLTRFGQQGASSRMRSFQFLPYLRTSGIECVVSPLFDDSLLLRKYKYGNYTLWSLLLAYWRRIQTLRTRHRFDLIWIEKEALPWMPVWFERLLLSGKPYVLDFDDAIFHKYDLHRLTWVRHVYGRRIDRLMAGACLVVAGNTYLAQRARDAGATRVVIVPTVIDLDRYAAKSTLTHGDEPLRIVWVGSPSTVRYLALLREPLAALSRQFAFKFRVIGGGEIDLPNVDVECVQWTEATEAALIQACDIGVMPLLDSPWERGKCGYKLVQYMACGLPVVASPVGANGEIVREGENGFLADSAHEWVEALARLLSDAALRQRMGKDGRQRVVDTYSIQQVASQLVALLRSVDEGR